MLALLTVRSFVHLRAVDLGFDPEGVVAIRVALPGSYRWTRSKRLFFSTLVERLESVPGITRAGVVSTRPLGGLGPATNVYDAIGPAPAAGQGLVSDVRFSDAGYFAAMRIRLLHGSTFAQTDTLDGPPVVLITRHWPGTCSVR